MADPFEIIHEVEALIVHCRPPVMSVEQRSRWQQDWAHDLAKYEIDVIQSAFRQWRQGESQKFPTPGQIIPMLERMSHRPGAAPDGASQAWRYDVADDEYRDMSLNEKIRHHSIAASHCRQKAGPMWGDGKRKTAEQMPQEWHDWRERADRHDAERARLRQSIGRWDQRA
jgi:hypothetical protein